MFISGYGSSQRDSKRNQQISEVCPPSPPEQVIPLWCIKITVSVVDTVNS